MTGYLIALAIGFLLGKKGVASDAANTITRRPPTPKVPSTENALRQLDGIEERLRLNGHTDRVVGLASIRAALAGETGGPKRE